jgi:hypothetical protein
MNCNGSRLMAAVLPPDTDQTARDEGNAAHWMAQKIFDGASVDSLIDTKAFNGFTMTAEMAEHVASYVSSLDCGAMEVATTHGGTNWHINGRADHIVDNTVKSTLTVDDFKYGWRIVEPDHNWTLISHAIGYCKLHKFAPAEITLRIHQPRPHHPNGKLRTWTISYAQLMEFNAQIEATLSNPSDQLTSGVEWCAKCYALPTCPAARLARYNAIDATTDAFDDTLSDEVLSYELDLLRNADATIKAQRDALEELIAHKIKQGAIVPNYGLEPQYAHTRFKSGISPQALTLASGIDCIKPGTITPAEFKRRGGSQAVYDALTERPMTGVKLVRATADQRAARLLNKGN